MVRNVALGVGALVAGVVVWFVLVQRPDTSRETEPDRGEAPSDDPPEVASEENEETPGDEVVTRRVPIHIQDVYGQPISGAEITVRGKGPLDARPKVVHVATTGADGWGKLVLPYHVMISSSEEIWLDIEHPEHCAKSNRRTTKHASKLSYELRPRSDLVVVPLLLDVDGELESCTLTWPGLSHSAENSTTVAELGELPFELEGFCWTRFWVLVEARTTGGEELVGRWTEIEVSPGSSERVEVVLEPWASLEGRVLASDGTAVSGARVLVLVSGQKVLKRQEDARHDWMGRGTHDILSLTADEHGRFRYDALLPGRGWMFAHGGGEHSGEKCEEDDLGLVPTPVEFEPGANELELRLQPSSPVVLRFVDEVGESVPGISLDSWLSLEWYEEGDEEDGLGPKGWGLSVELDLPHLRSGPDGRVSLPRWAVLHGRVDIHEADYRERIRSSVLESDADGDVLIRLP